MRFRKEVMDEYEDVLKTIEEYGYKDGTYELSEELNGNTITDDMLILQGQAEALKWLLDGEVQNDLELDITESDCHELMDGRVFNWQYNTVQGQIINVRLFIERG